MSSEERSAWIQGIVTILAYVAYLFIVLGLAKQAPLTEVAYVTPLLWSIGVSIVATIVIRIIATIFSQKGGDKTDTRDKQIRQFGDHIGQSFVVIGGVAAIILALIEAPYFWIANVIYLGFAASAVLSSIAKIVAYRRGFQTW
jgi:hypothetical protein